MHHSDDAYATMLLTMAISPDKEEYARPLNNSEFRHFEELVRASRFRGIGRLLDLDVSGFSVYFGLTDAEGYRMYTLLHRSMQLSYALESYMMEELDVVTQYDVEDYPQRLLNRLGEAAPPFFYRCGNAEIITRPAIGILGISGVKTGSEVREAVEGLVRDAVKAGYAIITGGELGVCRVAAGAVDQCGGSLLEILGGNLHEHMREEATARMLSEGRCALISMEHPDAMYTVSHAASRNKVLFSLADAAFVFNSDGRRGEGEALQNRYCDWIYAWEGYAGNRSIIARGARPIRSQADLDLGQISRHWQSSRSEQLNIFDLLN